MVRQGELGLLTIVTIFVVVLSVMYGGVRYSEGRLLPEDGRSPAEASLHAELVETLEDRRAARGLGPIGHGTWTMDAQDTAETLAERGAFPDRSSLVGTPGGATLPNALSRCTQVPVKYTGTDRAWRNVSADSIPDALAVEVGRTVADRLAAEASSVVFRESNFNNRVGVAMVNETVYAVYRSCEAITD